MLEIWLAYAWHMLAICSQHAGRMLDICFEYAWHMLGMCLEYAWNMRGICLPYAWNKLGICSPYAWNKLAMDLEYAWHMPRAHWQKEHKIDAWKLGQGYSSAVSFVCVFAVLKTCTNLCRNRVFKNGVSQNIEFPRNGNIRDDVTNVLLASTS